MTDARRGTAVAILAPRLVQIPLVLLIVSVAVFVLVQVVPGDPGRTALGPAATPEQVAAWNTANGGDDSALERYVSWMAGLLSGDWGTSAVYGVAVEGLVVGRLGNSIALGALAFAILVPAAIAIGVLQARREGSRTDRALTIVLMALASVPEFVVGLFLLVLFALVVPVFPIQSAAVGGMPPLRAMILPAATLVLGSLAVLARTARVGVVETMRSQFYRTAVLKGAYGFRLFRAHVARNALIPTVSVTAISLGGLLGGSAVVETLFGYPGLGELLVTATQQKDVAVLAAGVMVVGALSLVALMLADLAFVLIDPRVRYTAVSG